MPPFLSLSQLGCSSPLASSESTPPRISKALEDTVALGLDLLVLCSPEVLGFGLAYVVSASCLGALFYQFTKLQLVLRLGILIRLSCITELISCVVLHCENIVQLIIIFIMQV